MDGVLLATDPRRYPPSWSRLVSLDFCPRSYRDGSVPDGKILDGLLA